MKIFIIGVGMDGDLTLTIQAKNAVEKADVLIGSERAVKPFLGLGKRVFYSWKTSEIKEFLSNNSFENAAILLSGDSGFFSAARLLSEEFFGCETEIICGISSPSYFCAKIKKPWQQMKFISLHGEKNNVVRAVCENEFCFFLLGGEITPAEICTKLCKFGRGKIRVYIGENLAYPSEKITIGTAEELTQIECSALCVLVTENPDFERVKSVGIADEKFLRGDVPMTKSAVRAAVISRLEIPERGICWDVGAGTGSVSVEMALQCGLGTVYAIEKSDIASELIQKNLLKFGCDNVEIVKGSAPEILHDLPSPDRVFIGGSGGKLSEIIDVIFAKNMHCKIVISAVCIDTLSECLNALKAHGISAPEVIQLSVSRTEFVGKHAMLRAENPIFLITAQKESE